jgi:N-acetylmuramate 1-kinase
MTAMTRADAIEKNLDERVRRYLSSGPLGLPAPCRVSRLAGDASNRLYYRVQWSEGEGEARILTLLPAPFEPAELPFLEVAELFRAIPLRVPEIHDVAGELGILLQEDLGDRLLQDEVSAECPPTSKRALYRDAIEILVRLQKRGEELRSDRYLPFRIAFDAKKFSDELAFFRDHFLVGYSKARLSSSDRTVLDEELQNVAAELASEPYALCHRDYHARNLLVFGAEPTLAVIDFQDARMGPRCYDLVSLANDSYVVHEDELVADMKDRFASAVGADVASEYDLAALQRNLKALGTFGYQISVHGNQVYVQYVSHTLGLVRANLERNPRWDRLRRVLGRYLPELG